jgi:hypothetical protein
MTSIALPFLFITQLAVALGMLWLWWRVKDRMAALDARAAESLDDQDLMEFQERIVGLLASVKEAGKDVVAVIDERRAALDREGARAREAEKRLAEKIRSFERVEEKARKRLEDWAKAQSRRSPAKVKKPSKAGLGQPSLDDSMTRTETGSSKPANLADVLAETGMTPLKVTYLKRDFKAPEPAAPVSPTATRYLKVYEMADAGSSREEIAKACGYLPGEVELILNLRPRPRN